MEHKVSKQILDSWNCICEVLIKYHKTVELGFSHVKLLTAHRTTFDSVKPAEIEDTTLYRQDPEIKSKLLHAIRKEINIETKVLADVLKELDQMHQLIIKECDKVFSLFNTLRENLDLSHMTAATETTSSISDMLAALDRFKIYFSDDHLARKYSIERSSLGVAPEDLLSFWDSSELQSVTQDVGCIISISE
ncbi:uncharacterized protein LOC129229291 [Uloborus diversus]|uniref:uncharacterized protein LOC129229291 n=1 Tax=Uloborus diversus TaxID=327109 RepID=UPI00240A3F16|nr:uncharacterized protein LOC129229291 [Uloborus diversus]XP_054719539.1 uncharacterized protein LOC129229291 [Uloborus diversus]